MNDLRSIVKRALCHGVVGLVAQGSTEARAEIDRYDLAGSLTEEEHAVLRGESVGRRGYEQESAFALIWLLGLVDDLPAFGGDASAFQNAEVEMFDTLFGRFESVDEFVGAAQPRPRAEIDQAIARLETAVARYGSQVPGGARWIGPISREAAKARLSALQWAIGPADET